VSKPCLICLHGSALSPVSEMATPILSGDVLAAVVSVDGAAVVSVDGAAVVSVDGAAVARSGEDAEGEHQDQP
jgi:hypothetical protein